MGRHLQKKDRYHIEIELKKHTSVLQIAKDLAVNPATIYKEIKRGSFMKLNSDFSVSVVYAADVGQRIYDENKHRKGRKRKLESNDDYLQQISELIVEKKYSPEAAHMIIKDNKLCVKSLYNYIHSNNMNGVTIQNLPYAKPKKKKKTENKTGKRLSRGRSIEDRPKEISERKEYGHWEMDTVSSSKDDKTCLLVLSERMSREEMIFKIKNRTMESVIYALNRLERKIGTPTFRSKFKTITCDNGQEFSDWKSIEQSCRTKGKRTVVYFCHPYCSGERGTNENINRMIRRWIPKGDDIGLYTDVEIKFIQDWINNYPRKILGGLSANEYLMFMHR